MSHTFTHPTYYYFFPKKKGVTAVGFPSFPTLPVVVVVVVGLENEKTGGVRVGLGAEVVVVEGLAGLEGGSAKKFDLEAAGGSRKNETTW